MVVGAGHVGMITAARLADANVFGEIVLVDVVEGLAAGIALDLTHTAGLSGFSTKVTGAATVEEAGPADYVVITAGRARQPGMSRSDLMTANAAIVGDIAARVATVAPTAVLVVVTNPLDEMTQHAWRMSGLPTARVIGMAGVLDTARFRALAARAAGLRPGQIQAVALGSHGDEMVIPLSQASAAGRPLTEVLGEAALAAIVNRARDSGAEVVSLLKQGSAFMTPGASAARMVLAMAADNGQVLPAAVLADGSYGIEDVYIGLPARFGRGGVREIVELPLTPGELAELRQAADRIRQRLGMLVGTT
jgi:malate dehydrogenase